MVNKVILQIEEWKKRLIDLTRRNQLIFFSIARRNILEIKHPSLEKVFEKLFNEKKFNVWLPPKEDDEDPENPGKQSSLIDTQPEEGEKEVVLKENEIAFTLDQRKDIEKRLKTIYRKASSDYHEKGIRTSIIVLGLLWWKEEGSNEEVCSPLLLYPVEIAQATPQEPYKIFASEEDILLNPAVQVKLSRDFKTKLPEPDFDSEAWDLSEYLHSIEKLGKRDGWRVENRTFLGNFSFHKIAMYQDLSVNANLMSQHAIIKGLSEGSLEKRLCENDFPSEEDLDHDESPKKMLYILDADSSQSRAIEASVQGHSFVLKGPPGTGKSQTISNIIAEFLEEGKTVLFVSEKMAALEVVFNRLKQAKLTDYCLELHSHKTNKKEVIKELVRCLEERPTANIKVSNAELKKLTTLRNKLNDYILELHQIREPIDKSMYQVFGQLSVLEKMPLISIKLPNDSYSPVALQAMEELVQRLKNNFTVIVEGYRFPWRGFHSQGFSPAVRTEVLDLLAKIRAQINKIDGLFSYHATDLALNCPTSLVGCEWVLQISKHLISNPSPIRLWFDENEREKLLLEANKYCDLDETYQRLRSDILTDFNEDFFGLSHEIKNEFERSKISLKTFISDSERLESELLIHRKQVEVFLENSKNYLEICSRDIEEIKDALGLSVSSDYSLERAKQIVSLTGLLFAKNKPEKIWLDPVTLHKSFEILEKLQGYCHKYFSIIDNLKLNYDLAFLSMDIERLVIDYETKYRGAIKYFYPRYYLDTNQIKGFSKTHTVPKSILEDLRKAKDLQELKNTVESDSGKMRELLGSYFNKFETNLEETKSALDIAKQIIHLVGALPLPPVIIETASLSGVAHPNLEIVYKRLQTILSEWQDEIEAHAAIISAQSLATTKLPLKESSLTAVRHFVDGFSSALKDFNVIVAKIVSTRKNGDFNTCSEIANRLEALEKIKAYELEITGKSKKLSESFGDKFVGLKTNWREVIEALNWTKEFIKITEDTSLPDAFISKISDGVRTDNNEVANLEAECILSRKLVKDFENHFDNVENLFSKVQLEGMSFEDINNEIDGYIERMDDLRYWIDFVNAASKMRQYGLGSFIEKIAASPPNPGDLHNIFLKAFYCSWAEKVCNEVEALGEFRGINHNDLIAEFRVLDKKLNTLSASLIIEELNERRASLLEGVKGSEISVLRDQHARARRHFPLRMLFSRIPHLLLKLKPCLLMSPLSVSHYLDQANYCFDLIIFDEASQICSEDAVGAIARGKQLIVAGDNKQLPPTKFFQGELADDEDYEESEESFGVYQSVLDDCERIGLTPNPLMLKWHYRSKHESLIAYSNSRFYEHKLVTFPCAKEKDEGLGIKFVPVSDGIFDRGGKRNNLKEAERVADLIFEHFTKYGDKKTLGVATLNIPQRDTILDTIEQRRRSRPELDKYFQDDRLSGFFVKNLEAVQGDERDVIILSLGFGRDHQGLLTMNFGPINKEGGEKRLNVIVTRAKEKLILVSSIKASDFNLNNLNTEGARHLYHYLDYAERGKEALELHNVVDGDIDSPFEEEVKNEIRSLGYDAVSQVGCSSFRIDIGVIDPAHPGCFILGIECDGATYHHAFTARERDRIRQEVLEGLGWKIHRIWSPDWFFRRPEEITRLKSIIEKARTNGFCSQELPVTPEIKIRYDKRKSENFKDAEIENVIEYSPYRRISRYSSHEFNLPDSCHKRNEILVEIVSHESPIHTELAGRRLAAVWNIERMGPVVQDTVDSTIRHCLRQGEIYLKNKFLYSQYACKVQNVRKPIALRSETFREPDFISEKEIELALILIIKSAMSIEKEALFIVTARLFGWGKNTSRVEAVILKAFNKLTKAGKIQLNNELISLT